jgi:tRNA pseudouridine13 synthase
MTATERIRLYGLNVVVGDLVATNPNVLIDGDLFEESVETSNSNNKEESGSDSKRSKNSNNNNKSNNGGDNNNSSCQIQRQKHAQAADIHIVTQEDIDAKRYSMRDVILPITGSEVKIPANEVGAYLIDLLKQDQLSLSTFSECMTQYRSFGAYRALLSWPKAFSWKIIQYQNIDDELAETELNNVQLKVDEKKKKLANSNSNGGGSDVTNTVEEGQSAGVMDVSSTSASLPLRKAVQLTFTLNSGSYATMFLREITKCSTETKIQSELTDKSRVTAPNTDIDGGNNAAEDLSKL